MKNSCIFSLCVISFCLFLGCTDDEEEVGGTVVGSWEEFVQAVPPYIPNDLVINLDVADTDSTFRFKVQEFNDDTLYWHTGKWDIHHTGGPRDSIFLYGQIGSVIDTTADALVSLPDSLALRTFAIDTAGSTGDCWIINIKNLEDILTFFIDQQTIDKLAVIDFYMERK